MRTLLFGLVLLTGVGCNVTPVGPLAKWRGAPKGAPLPGKDDPPDPVTVQAPRPVPPAKLIDPEEVTAANAAAAKLTLQKEIDADNRTMPAAPKTAEVSRYKDGVKVK